METLTLDIDVAALQELPEEPRAATDELAGADLAKCQDTCYATCLWTCTWTWW